MSFSEFGEIVQPAAQKGQYKEFGDVIEPLSRGRSLINAPAKGAVKRAGDIAEFVQSIAPFIPKGPLTKEKAHKFAKEKFPTFEREPEEYLERAGGVATEAFLSPGSLPAKAIQILLGAGLGHAAEKLGAPEWAQSLLEGAPFFFKGGKKIPIKKEQKQFVDFLRNKGFTDNEITPFLKSPEQINRWSKLANKGKKSRKLVESIYEKTGPMYNSVIEEGKNLRPLNELEKTDLLQSFTKISNDIPDKFRKLIQNDMNDFLTKGRAGIEDLINLDRDINAVIGAEKGGKGIVGLFKGPIEKAITSIDPQLANDYTLAKRLYSSRSNIKGALVNPNDLDKLIDIGEAYGLGQAIYNRDLNGIMKVIGVAGGRKLATEMLINPRLQNISVRIGEALKKNKYLIAEKYLREFTQELSKEDQELANQIDELATK